MLCTIIENNPELNVILTPYIFRRFIVTIKIFTTPIVVCAKNNVLDGLKNRHQEVMTIKVCILFFEKLIVHHNMKNLFLIFILDFIRKISCWELSFLKLKAKKENQHLRIILYFKINWKNILIRGFLFYSIPTN